MKQFDWTSFTQRIAIQTTMEKAYNAWTTKQSIEQWFLSTAVFTDHNGNLIPAKDNVFEGAKYDWNWFLYEPTESGKITSANGVDFFQFTFAGACLVDIRLKQVDECVVVELKQYNIPTDEASMRSIRLGCHTGWAFYLVNLKSVLEGGLDLRNKDERFMPPMVNS
ncbi:MAG: SRPBCC domain-containing protein [Fluviicola sp.]|nr:SRPBCC domain-containing protein [Fluviicola sp.]